MSQQKLVPQPAEKTAPSGARAEGARPSYERQTARLAAISWLAQGQWVKVEGKEPSYVVTPHGERVSRCRVLATIVQVYVSEDGQFASITLDDGTETIRAKAFKDIELLRKCAVGQRVDVIGKLREYNGELYIIAEAIAPITDPNAELLRRLELVRAASSAFAPVPALAPAGAGAFGAGAPADGARQKILDALAKSGDGLTYEELVTAAGSEEAAERAITALLEEGVCYEPTPGKIRKI